MRRQFISTIPATLLLALSGTVPLQAHPHVWAEARLDLAIEDGKVAHYQVKLHAAFTLEDGD